MISMYLREYPVVHKGNAPLLEDVMTALDGDPSSPSDGLVEMLKPYTRGLYSGYFNSPTTFDITEERLVVFGPQHVNDTNEQLRVYLWQVMGLIWGEVLRRHAANTEITQHVMLDEAWRLLESDVGGSAVENMARRFRKRRTALWLATQEVGEFLDTPAGKRILSVMGNTFLMEQRSVEARRLVEAMNLDAGLSQTLQRLGTGRGLLITPERTVQLWIAVPEAWGVY